MGCALNERSNVRAGMVPRYLPLSASRCRRQRSSRTSVSSVDASTSPKPVRCSPFVVQQRAARRIGDRSMGNDELLR